MYDHLPGNRPNHDELLDGLATLTRSKADIIVSSAPGTPPSSPKLSTLPESDGTEHALPVLPALETGPVEGFHAAIASTPEFPTVRRSPRPRLYIPHRAPQQQHLDVLPNA
ncbi:hypothetical protein B0H14DRAFT_3495269 [Mycena olivaceomarginata]|nr:hypothetical protein B0H14DRAFT_3495269 [Mycena olivaceomarginata]